MTITFMKNYTIISSAIISNLVCDFNETKASIWVNVLILLDR